MRANAEGEFQGLVLRSNQEQSFFQERNLRTRQWKEALLVLGLSEEPDEREILSETKICQNMFSNQEPGASETSKPLRSRPP